MDIKVVYQVGQEKILNLSEYRTSLTSLCFENEITGDIVELKELNEIQFNENNFFIQMVDAIKDLCIIHYKENDAEIKLGTYKG